MNHVFEGEPDGRQSSEVIPVSRFRPKYRALTDAEKALHDQIKAKAVELEALFEQARDLRLPTFAIGVDVQDDGVKVTAEGIDAFAEACIGELDPTVEYFCDGMKSLELAVMWTVKGLTA